MSTEDQFGLEITELRLGLPGGGGGGERKVKKRVFLDILGGGDEVDLCGNGGGKNRNMEVAVGWPPVCSYRKRTIIKMYVKVSMDGAPFLRKIDINGFKGYSDFVMALEKLFGLGDECEYIPIYEDNNGDWMLVGFVPWEMFTETCKRLRMKKKVLDGGLQTKNLMRKNEN
ncbi:putative transcription factor interactor and regulator AUX-IAA family [Helianthus annuus]|nr:putative transcription factor interactor and regulator AUX-IAA family [Helianthus annuus]